MDQTFIIIGWRLKPCANKLLGKYHTGLFYIRLKMNSGIYDRSRPVRQPQPHLLAKSTEIHRILQLTNCILIAQLKQCSSSLRSGFIALFCAHGNETQNVMECSIIKGGT